MTALLDVNRDQFCELMRRPTFSLVFWSDPTSSSGVPHLVPRFIGGKVCAGHHGRHTLPRSLTGVKVWHPALRQLRLLGWLASGGRSEQSLCSISESKL